MVWPGSGPQMMVVDARTSATAKNTTIRVRARDMTCYTRLLTPPPRLKRKRVGSVRILRAIEASEAPYTCGRRFPKRCSKLAHINNL